MNSLLHFVRLANRGKPGTGASSGELQARLLALCAIQNIPGLDGQAVNGFIEFIRGVQQDCDIAREAVDDVMPE